MFTFTGGIAKDGIYSIQTPAIDLRMHFRPLLREHTTLEYLVDSSPRTPLSGR
jgi:hypothetical protein